MHYENGTVKPKHIESDEFLKAKFILQTQYPKQYSQLFELYKHRESYLKYMITMYLSAYAYRLYQDYLDSKFQCLEEVTNGNKSKPRNPSGREDQAQRMEP